MGRARGLGTLVKSVSILFLEPHATNGSEPNLANLYNLSVKGAHYPSNWVDIYRGGP
jgi:hypothetical protein